MLTKAKLSKSACTRGLQPHELRQLNLLYTLKPSIFFIKIKNIEKEKINIIITKIAKIMLKNE